MKTGIKLSELCSMETPPAVARDIVCDVASFTPPSGVRVAAFRYETDKETGDYSEDLLDTLVAWGVIARTNVQQERKITPIIEIPFGTENIIPEQALYIAASGGVSLSLLPPEEKTESNMTEWTKTVCEFGKTMLHTTHFGGRIYPFNDVLEIAFMESLSESHAESAKEHIWDDKCGHLHFKTYAGGVFSEVSIDELLPAVRKTVHDHFGGEEAFRHFANEIPRLCWEKTEDAVKSNINAKREALEA